MKCFTFHLALLSLIFASNILAQSPRFRTLNTTTGVLGAPQNMPSNAVADDFGPRDYGTDDFHGGVDFNCAQGDGDNDKWYPMISPQAGTFGDYNHMTHGQDRYKYALVNVNDGEGNGSHTLLFGHVFDWHHQFYNEIGGRIVLNNCSGDDDDKWGLHLNFTDAQGNAVTHTYGQIAGAILDINGTAAGGTFTTTNVVNTTNIFMPVGNSGGNDRNRYLAHLHLNTLPYNTEASSDAVNGDPCQFLNIDRPDYIISSRSEQNENGISLTYPGTHTTKIRARVSMFNEPLNVNRYNHLVDLDKVQLEIKKSYDLLYNVIQGDQSRTIIVEGGRLGHEVINHTNPIDKTNWNSNGINSNAYNGATTGANAGNPWDDYYFIDFKTRIHKNDLIFPLLSLFSDTPENVRYNDGEYNFQVKAVSAANREETGDQRVLIIDNFQPFIHHFNFRLENGTNLYYCSRNQDEGVAVTANDGRATIENTYHPVQNAINNNYPIAVKFSEPVSTVTISATITRNGQTLNVAQKTMTQNGNTGLDYSVEFTTQELHNITIADVIRFKIKAQDKSGNTLIDAFNLTNNNRDDQRFIIPTRRDGTANETYTATHWTNPPAHRGQDYFEIVMQSCQQRSTSDNPCSELESMTAEVLYDKCNFATIKVVLANSSAYTISWTKDGVSMPSYYGLFELINVQEGHYCYTIESAESCCTSKSCLEVLKDNLYPPDLIFVSAEMTTSCDAGSTISIINLEQQGSEIKWYIKKNGILTYLKENDNKVTIDNLNPITEYVYHITKNNCTKVSSITTPSEVFYPLMIKNPTIKNISCTESTAIITFFAGSVSGGTFPYTYLWSNGMTALNISNLAIGEYTLTVTDANGCTATKIVEVNASDNYISSSNVAASCQNINNGSIEIMTNLIGGEFPIIEWEDEFGNSVASFNEDGYSLIENLNSGQYCAKIIYSTTKCNLTKCYFVPILDPTPLSLTFSQTPSCSGQATGTIKLKVIGGAGAYRYKWSNGSTNSNLENLVAGTYSVTISDKCENNLYQTFNVENYPANSLIASHLIVPHNTQEQKIDLTTNGQSINWYKFNENIQSWSIIAQKEDLTGSLFPGKYKAQIFGQNGCSIEHEVFECENASDLKFDFSFNNLNNCNEQMKIEAKAVIKRGNPPFKYIWNNSIQSEKIILPVTQYFFKNDYYQTKLKLTDNCGFVLEKTSNEFPCDLFCPIDNIGIKHNKFCYDGCNYLTNFLWCSKVSIFDNNTDDKIREINSGVFGFQYTQFQNGININGGNDELKLADTGSSTFANYIDDYTIKDVNTGCIVARRLQIPIRCVEKSIWEWFRREFQGCSCPSGDSDGDLILDIFDNCPNVENPDQEDYDQNDVGDACEGDENYKCKELQCKDECKLCKKEYEIDCPECESGKAQSEDLVRYCKENQSWVIIASQTIVEGKIKKCPAFVNYLTRKGVIINESMIFGCDDQQLIFHKGNKNFVDYSYIKKGKSDTLRNDLYLNNGYIIRNVNIPLSSSESNSYVYYIKSALEDFLFFQQKDALEVKCFKNDSLQYSSKIENANFLKGENGNIIYYSLENKVNIIKIENNKLVNKDIDMFNQDLEYFPSNMTSKIMVDKNVKVLKLQNQNVDLDLTISNFKIFDASTLSNGSFLITGLLNGSISILGNTFTSSSEANIFSVMIDESGKLTHSYLSKNHAIDNLLQTIYLENGKIGYAYKNILDGKEQCIEFGLFLLCPILQCCDSMKFNLNFDQQLCKLGWTLSNSTYSSTLQYKNSNNEWVDLPSSNNNYIVSASNSGTYRVRASKADCSDLFSDTIAAECNTVCNCIPASLIYSHQNCSLSWDPPCTGFSTTLQKKSTSGWTTIASTQNPYTPEDNGEYRLITTKSGCQNLVSNSVLVDCVCETCTFAYDWDRDEFFTQISSIIINNQVYSPPSNSYLAGDMILVGNYLYNQNLVNYLNNLNIADDCFEASVPTVTDFVSNCIGETYIDEYSISNTNIIKLKHKKGSTFNISADFIYSNSYNETFINPLYNLNNEGMYHYTFSTFGWNPNYPDPFFIPKCNCTTSSLSNLSSKQSYKPYVNEIQIKFDSIAEGRKISSFSQLPLHLKKEVNQFIDKYRPEEIWVQGSYATGKYHNSVTDINFLNLKRQLYLQKGKQLRNESDLDLYVVGSNFDSLVIHEGNIEATKTNYGNGFLIYKSGKFVDDQNSKLIFSAYPNPFSNGITIKVNSETEKIANLKVTNTQGTLLYADDFVTLGKGDTTYYITDS